MNTEYINQLYSGTKQAVMLLDKSDGNIKYVVCIFITVVLIELLLSAIPSVLRIRKKKPVTVKEEEINDEEE